MKDRLIIKTRQQQGVYNNFIFYLKCFEFRWTLTTKETFLYPLAVTKALIPEVLLFPSLELSAQVDEQKRVIRKLTLKVSKLEEALKKERRETKQPKICSMSDIPLATQFSALKD